MYSVSKGPIFSSGDLDIEERDGLVFFLLHGEFDEWMLRVEVLQELVKCCLSVGPNHEGVINIAEPEVGAKISVLDGIQFKLFHEQISKDRG